MAVLPDLGAALLYAAIVFLLALGVLIVFIETITARSATVVVVATFALAAAFSLASEAGLAFIMMALGAAVVVNHLFEWLTTR